MTKYFRITIVVALVLVLAILAKDRVGGASGSIATSEANPSAQSQNQPVQVQQGQPVALPQSQAALAQVEGFVWKDLDQDGLQDINEGGVPKVTVNLYNSSNALVDTTTTDKNGAYQFKNLVPGDYYVGLVPTEGYLFSLQDQGENELVDSDVDPNAASTKLATLVVGENDLVWTTGLYQLASPAAQPEPGTVKPPPADIKVCEQGFYSLGGVASLRVNRVAPDYCLHAFLWNHAFAIGRIPGGAGRVLAEVTFLEVFYQNRFVYKYDVPTEVNSIQICYTFPVGKQTQIYFLNFYGPRFGERTGKPAWEPLQTTVVADGIACAVAQTSGAYALIGK